MPDHSQTAIIGAGIGGLATALRLAQAGMSVTVFDSHPAPGGKMRTRDSAAGPVDIGPTVMTMRPVFEALFADCGERLTDHVTLAPDAILARHFWPDGSRLDLTGDRAADERAIAAFAGSGEARAFARFSDRARTLFDAFDAPIMQAARPRLPGLVARVLGMPRLWPALLPGLTLAGVLAKEFRDPRLQQLFGRYATYVGGSPYQSPAVLGLIWQSEANGVWSIKGGMHALARALHDLAVAKGVRFEFNTTVARIIRENGRAAAVVLADGTRFAADQVVFNGDPKALGDGLLGPEPRRAVPRSGVTPRSLSAFVWGFAAKPHGVDLAHHNVFFGADPKQEFDDLAAGRMPQDGTLYVCAQDRGATPPGSLERFEIILNGPAGHKSTEEDAKTCKTRTFTQLARQRLSFTPEPGIDALTMPMDFNAAFPGSDGSLYGRSPHGMTATFRRPTARTRMAGLYLCGGGAHPGAGIPMACLSGKHAAEAILSDRASTSTSRPTATPGGTSTESATMARGRSPSSVS